MDRNTLECGSCHIKRARIRFSQNQINRYENTVRRANKLKDRSVVVLPRCSNCSGAPVHELKCAGCDVVKPLDDFSRQQRRNPDNALCGNCSQEKQDLEAEHVDQVQEVIIMDRIRAGATSTNVGAGSTSFGQPANSRATGYSNGPLASTNIDGSSEWIQDPIPVPEDPRARFDSGSSGTRSPSVVSHNTYTSSASAITGTAWDNYGPTHATYRANFRRSSDGSGSKRGGNAGFARQGAVRPDSTVRAQNALSRQQLRESEQAEQAATRGSDDDDDDSDSGSAY